MRFGLISEQPDSGKRIGGSPRILHVLSTPRAEGTPNLVLDWLAAGSACWQGIMVLHSQPADLMAKLRAGADAYEEHNLHVPGYQKFFRIAATAYAAVRKYQPDVLVCWPTGFANWVCAGAYAAGCRKLLVHAGNPPRRGFRGDWMSRYGIWPLAVVGARVVCCSNYVRDEYRAIPAIGRSRFQTIYNCARTATVAERAHGARAARSQDSCRYGIMVATLEAHKDHATLLEAMPAILRHAPNFRLRLVGDGSLRTVLEQQAKRLEVAGHVDFLGTRTDVPELLGQSDLFILSTTAQEGLGSVLLEALAAELPVVASDVPACREVLEQGRWGVLVPPRNPEQLTNAVCAALEAPPAREAREQGAAYAAGFQPGRMMREYLNLVGLQVD